jgi:beta-glucosidase-like glycosyl hydrolase
MTSASQCGPGRRDGTRPAVRRTAREPGRRPITTGGPVQYPATALPAPISLAETRDLALAARYGEVEGKKALDQGRTDVEGPDINIARVPTIDRMFEAAVRAGAGSVMCATNLVSDTHACDSFTLAEGE